MGKIKEQIRGLEVIKGQLENANKALTVRGAVQVLSFQRELVYINVSY